MVPRWLQYIPFVLPALIQRFELLIFIIKTVERAMVNQIGFQSFKYNGPPI